MLVCRPCIHVRYKVEEPKLKCNHVSSECMQSKRNVTGMNQKVENGFLGAQSHKINST